MQSAFDKEDAKRQASSGARAGCRVFVVEPDEPGTGARAPSVYWFACPVHVPARQSAPSVPFVRAA